ncbi:MAG: Holliday junction resolvase RuvX [Blastocatellia bacterium]|nr:Holliday junction resolvase RuvX [Blastocatellia bacterium]
MLDKQITNQGDFSEILSLSSEGRIIALDLGTKKIGVAVCDERQITTRPLTLIKRKSWKDLLKQIVSLIEEFDAIALVLGLPYNFDGTECEMSQEARRLQRNFSLSLKIPVFLQDERLTSKSAQQDLFDSGLEMKEILKQIDSQAAAIILEDFLSLRAELKKRKPAL